MAPDNTLLQPQPANPLPQLTDLPPAPAQSSTPFPPAPPPSAGPATAGSPAPTTGPAALPPNATIGPTQQAGAEFAGEAPAQHSIAYKALNALVGGRPTGYVQSPNGPVAVKRDWAPGELAQHVVASAASVLASGFGGMLAAKQHRPFVQNPETSLGAIKNAPQEQAKEQAQQEFENSRAAQHDMLLAQQNAREQQKSVQDAALFAQETKSNDQKLAAGDRAALNDQYNSSQKMDDDFNRDISAPGAKIYNDPKTGQPVSFAIDPNDPQKSLRDAQAYATAHPEVFHGTVDPNNPASRYLVSIRRDPATNSWVIVDRPPDYHAQTIEYDGAQRDAHGDVMFDDKGNPIPAKNSPYRDKAGNPIVSTQTVSQAQHDYLEKQHQEKAKSDATIDDYIAQGKEREAAARKSDAGDTAWNLYLSGQTDRMTPQQRGIVAHSKIADLQAANKRYSAAEAAYEKAASTVPDEDEKQKLPEYKELQEAKSDYNDALQDYNTVLGRTPGIVTADKLTRNGVPIVDAQGKQTVIPLGQATWPQIYTTIQGAGMSEDEVQKAQKQIYNSGSPAQQAAWRQQQQQQAAGGNAEKPAAGGGATATSGVKKQVPPTPAPAGQTYIYNPAGMPFAVPTNEVAAQLKANKGWTE